MASSSSFAITILCCFLLLTVTPALSATNCSSQTFSNNKLYSSCNDLPTLNSSLHWNYHSTNSTVDVAFIAPPASPNGWIAWGINPNNRTMLGTQALIAFKHSNGSLLVQTFNISSYQIKPSPIDYKVSNPKAEFYAGQMRIFATFTLPKSMTEINQVWQVGSSVSGSLPAKHAFAPENLRSVGKLDLVGGGSAPSPSPSPSASGSNSSAPQPSIGSMTTSGSFSGSFLILTALFALIQ